MTEKEQALSDIFVDFITKIQMGYPQAANELAHVFEWERVTGRDFVTDRDAIKARIKGAPNHGL